MTATLGRIGDATRAMLPPPTVSRLPIDDAEQMRRISAVHERTGVPVLALLDLRLFLTGDSSVFPEVFDLAVTRPKEGPR